MKEAKIKYKQGSFEVIKEGDYVLCAISKKKNFIKRFKVLECQIARTLLIAVRNQ